VKKKRSKLRAILPFHDRGKTVDATESWRSLRRRRRVRESEEEAIGREWSWGEASRSKIGGKCGSSIAIQRWSCWKSAYDDGCSYRWRHSLKFQSLQFSYPCGLLLQQLGFFRDDVLWNCESHKLFWSNIPRVQLVVDPCPLKFFPFISFL